MKTIPATKYNELKLELDGFLLRVKQMNDQTDHSALKLFNKELESFLNSNAEEDDGFLESLKHYNQTGTWCNRDFLKRIIRHFQTKWGNQHSVIIYPH